MLKSRSFAVRLVVSAIAVACLIVVVILLATAARSEEPRNATPVEISQAALEGQIEALRKAGFDENCLFEIDMYGKLCIQQCVPGGTGFALHLNGTLPECTVRECTCEGDPQEPTS